MLSYTHSHWRLFIFFLAFNSPEFGNDLWCMMKQVFSYLHWPAWWRHMSFVSSHIIGKSSVCSIVGLRKERIYQSSVLLVPRDENPPVTGGPYKCGNCVHATKSPCCYVACNWKIYHRYDVITVVIVQLRSVALCAPCCIFKILITHKIVNVLAFFLQCESIYIYII